MPAGVAPQHTMIVYAIGDQHGYDAKYELIQVAIDPRFVVLADDRNLFKWNTIKNGWILLFLSYIRTYFVLLRTYRKRNPLNVINWKNYTVTEMDEPAGTKSKKKTQTKLFNSKIEYFVLVWRSTRAQRSFQVAPTTVALFPYTEIAILMQLFCWFAV